MMSILDKEELRTKQNENKAEIIQILETFLKQSNSNGLDVSTLDVSTWLGWTVVNGTAHEVEDLIRSKLPLDPLIGMSEPKQLSNCKNLTYGGS